MADEDSERDELPEKSGGLVAAARPVRKSGFFTIYKKGQGYWTRMGTALGAALLSLLFAQFVYSQLHAANWESDSSRPPRYLPVQVCVGIAAGCLVVLMFICWRLMNKPRHVDFLIATDSEMKKVNWTTRKELIGSTKVVIIFVILISLFLFLLDVLFGYFFQLIRVLEFGPFQ